MPISREKLAEGGGALRSRKTEKEKALQRKWILAQEEGAAAWLTGMANDSTPTSTCRICPAPLPHATAAPSASSPKSCEEGDISGQIFLAWLLPGEKGREARDWAGRRGSRRACKVLVILSSLCTAPTAAKQEKEHQLGMLICHELTYLQNCTQVPLGQGARPGPEWGGEIESVSFLQGLQAGGACLRGEISKLGSHPTIKAH